MELITELKVHGDYFVGNHSMPYLDINNKV
jgi:hypothetical protein